MKNKIILAAILLMTEVAMNAQVSVNNTDPKATFDVTAKNATGNATNVDGILIPRVDRQRAENMATIETSTLIYVNSIATGAALGKAQFIDAVGFYSYDGSNWQKFGASSTYAASTSIALNGTSFERAALTGDVTAAANSNATTIATNAVTSAKILDETIATADLADFSVTPAKIATPVRTVTASTTLEDTDKGGFVYVNSTSATTITVPSTLAAGFHVVVVQQGTGQVTIAGSGVTLTTARGTKTRAQYSGMGIIKQTTVAGTITGDTIN